MCGLANERTTAAVVAVVVAAAVTTAVFAAVHKLTVPQHVL